MLTIYIYISCIIYIDLILFVEFTRTKIELLFNH